MGAELLLQKYLNHLITYVSQVLNTATEIACRSNKHFYAVSNILKCNGIGNYTLHFYFYFLIFYYNNITVFEIALQMFFFPNCSCVWLCYTKKYHYFCIMLIGWNFLVPCSIRWKISINYLRIWKKKMMRICLGRALLVILNFLSVVKILIQRYHRFSNDCSESLRL